MTRLNLPDLESEIAAQAEFRQPLHDHGGSPSPTRAAKRLHVSKVGGGVTGRAYEGRWEWAVILRAVSGWKVIAHGTDVNTGTPKTHEQVWEMIAEQCAGENGDGFDRLPDHQYAQTGASRTAHIRRPDDATQSYCGKPAWAPAVFDTSDPNHVQQMCTDCDAAYRAQHWGRTPVQA